MLEKHKPCRKFRPKREEEERADASDDLTEEGCDKIAAIVFVGNNTVPEITNTQ